MIVAFCTSVMLAVVLSSVVANQRFPKAANLPMQWDLAGKPMWFAPRVAALAFTPLLAISVTGFIFMVAGRAEGHIAALVAVAFLAAHLLHLMLVYRHLTRP
ncbi:MULTISPECIES: hypothetical protein [unclassified Paracoccus (in: a-proteobacteria)]|uniref:hypothetical protein n=1 Tax=unclassified Paracoccus (in: a-proteobacteria) TaxID=2688777 RepID=UPI001F44AF6E|nr:MULTISPECIES: hypothetical protein [unclassified Paracoccus (in: a-proteobacteria)]